MFNVRTYNTKEELNTILNSIEPEFEEIITCNAGVVLTRFI